MPRRSRLSIIALLGLVAFAVPTLAAQQDPPGTLVTGEVYDSIARRRIPGVTVQLVSADSPGSGRPLSGVTDSTGRYSIAGVAPGRYLGGFFHPALDTLGLEVAPRLVEVGARSARIDFGTPSPRTVMRTICPEGSADSSGLFMGHVRATEHQGTLEGATILVEWSEFVLDGARLYERPRQATAKTTGPGWFAFCGLPSDGTLLARAALGADSSGHIEIEVPAGGMLYQSFHVGGASLVTLPTDTAVRAPGDPPAPVLRVLRGDARLTGTVLDPNGNPVSNAHVLVWGTSVDVTTSDRGTFAIDGLPGGTHTLEVRVIGYVPVTRVVQLAASRPASIEIRLDRAAVILATETVRGKLVYSRQLEEFDRRRRTGSGRFITSDLIERRPNARLSQLLQGEMGVYVTQSAGQSTVLMRGSLGSYCVPTLYRDGQRDLSNDFDYLYADEIAGIEVYSRETQRPGGYTDSNRCGAVLVWTRSRGSKPDR